MSTFNPYRVLEGKDPDTLPDGFSFEAYTLDAREEYTQIVRHVWTWIGEDKRFHRAGISYLPGENLKPAYEVREEEFFSLYPARDLDIWNFYETFEAARGAALAAIRERQLQAEARFAEADDFRGNPFRGLDRANALFDEAVRLVMTEPDMSAVLPLRDVEPGYESVHYPRERIFTAFESKTDTKFNPYRYVLDLLHQDPESGLLTETYGYSIVSLGQADSEGGPAQWTLDFELHRIRWNWDKSNRTMTADWDTYQWDRDEHEGWTDVWTVEDIEGKASLTWGQHCLTYREAVDGVRALAKEGVEHMRRSVTEMQAMSENIGREQYRSPFEQDTHDD